MKISKQKLESLILEEIKSLQEGSPFEEKAKEAQNAWLASRPWTANALEVIRNSKSAADVDDVPSALFRFIEYGENEISDNDKSAWSELRNPKYNHDWIRGGLQGDNGGKILKIINDAFEISKTIPLKPFVDGNAKVTPRENPLSMDPLKSPPQLATDDDGYKYITFATENGSWVVIETPPTLNRDQPGIAIGKAPAGQGLTENKMKLTKQQLKQIIKEEIVYLLEVVSKDMRVATLGKPGLDQNPQEDEATLDAVKSMSQRQPEGPIGVDTIQNAINSGDFSTMKNVVLDALDYLGKMRMRYAGAGTGGVVDRWAKNSYKYGLEREENNPTPERHAEARKEFVKEDLMSLLRFVQTGEQ